MRVSTAIESANRGGGVGDHPRARRARCLRVRRSRDDGAGCGVLSVEHEPVDRRSRRRAGQRRERPDPHRGRYLQFHQHLVRQYHQGRGSGDQWRLERQLHGAQRRRHRARRRITEEHPVSVGEFDGDPGCAIHHRESCHPVVCFPKTRKAGLARPVSTMARVGFDTAPPRACEGQDAASQPGGLRSAARRSAATSASSRIGGAPRSGCAWASYRYALSRTIASITSRCIFV